MAASFRNSIFVSLLFLAGCTTALPIAMPTAEPVRVWGSGTDRLLQPADPDYRRLQSWVAANGNGWSSVYATNPNGGVFVSLGKMRLQFVGTAVFILTDHGMFSKDIKQSDYVFLTKPQGT